MRVNPHRHVIKLVKAESVRLRFLSRNNKFREDLNRAKTLEQEEELIKKWKLGVSSLDRSGRHSIATPVQVEKGEGCWVHIKVNGNHPIADLLPVIEIELSRFLGKAPHSGPRNRPEKADFQLEVLDRVMAGYTFSEIAREAKCSQSTIKGAYLSAKRKTFGPGDARSKKDLTLKSFDPYKHGQTCTVCRKADRNDQMCRVAKLYTNQDYRGQREAPRYDTVETSLSHPHRRR